MTAAGKIDNAPARPAPESSTHQQPKAPTTIDQPDPARPFAPAGRTRLTYIMAVRVGLVTLLLAAALVAELGAPLGSERAPVVGALFALIAGTYALTIVFALLLQRTRRIGPLAVAQLASDLLLTTFLVHLTGGPESAFAFMYILVIVGAAFLLGRGALAVTAAAIALYLAEALFGDGLPLRTLIRTLAVNGIAFAATGALATRLSAELRRAGESLESQGNLLRDLAALHADVIRGLTSGLVTIGRDERVLTFNAAAAEITGRSAIGAVGKKIHEVMPGLGALIESAGDGALRRGHALQPVTRDGLIEERTLGVSVSPLVDANGRLIGRILNFQDLTEVRRLEAAVLRAERLAAVGRLAAGVAHEIRNPLAAISGSIELLSQSIPSDAAKENRELMAIVLRETERLNRLITDLLGFARPRQLEPQRLDVAATLQEMLRVFENDKRLVGAHVELAAPSPVWVDADAEQLRQIVWNLLRNAAEAAPGQPITVEARSDGEQAIVRVRDRGPGISAEHRARVFEPFFSTKEGGTGLGLATVHRIIEEHRGAIEIDCPPEGGTIVTIRLPLVAAE
ncbi:MAG TPA: ATP-binding protein [Polyangia bacterium]|jgi:two-component system sensor histidine kinase PilS (NtrC family)|nr:ATP-binding protein [Polyangia bacterium]